jgi:hypothetical protein
MRRIINPNRTPPRRNQQSLCVSSVPRPLGPLALKSFDFLSPATDSVVLASQATIVPCSRAYSLPSPGNPDHLFRHASLGESPGKMGPCRRLPRPLPPVHCPRRGCHSRRHNHRHGRCRGRHHGRRVGGLAHFGSGLLGVACPHQPAIKAAVQSSIFSLYR